MTRNVRAHLKDICYLNPRDPRCVQGTFNVNQLLGRSGGGGSGGAYRTGIPDSMYRPIPTQLPDLQKKKEEPSQVPPYVDASTKKEEPKTEPVEEPMEEPRTEVPVPEPRPIQRTLEAEVPPEPRTDVPVPEPRPIPVTRPVAEEGPIEPPSANLEGYTGPEPVRVPVRPARPRVMPRNAVADEFGMPETTEMTEIRRISEQTGIDRGVQVPRGAQADSWESAMTDLRNQLAPIRQRMLARPQEIPQGLEQEMTAIRPPVAEPLGAPPVPPPLPRAIGTTADGMTSIYEDGAFGEQPPVGTMVTNQAGERVPYSRAITRSEAPEGSRFFDNPRSIVGGPRRPMRNVEFELPTAEMSLMDDPHRLQFADPAEGQAQINMGETTSAEIRAISGEAPRPAIEQMGVEDQPPEARTSTFRQMSKNEGTLRGSQPMDERPVAELTDEQIGNLASRDVISRARPPDPSSETPEALGRPKPMTAEERSARIQTLRANPRATGADIEAQVSRPVTRLQSLKTQPTNMFTAKSDAQIAREAQQVRSGINQAYRGMEFPRNPLSSTGETLQNPLWRAGDPHPAYRQMTGQDINRIFGNKPISRSEYMARYGRDPYADSSFWTNEARVHPSLRSMGTRNPYYHQAYQQPRYTGSSTAEMRGIPNQSLNPYRAPTTPAIQEGSMNARGYAGDEPMLSLPAEGEYRPLVAPATERVPVNIGTRSGAMDAGMEEMGALASDALEVGEAVAVL